MTARFNFGRELRLLTPSDFKFVFSKPFKVSSSYFILVARRNSLAHARVGFAIAKKMLKRAHERNRVKRIARDYFRLNQHKMPAIDVIVMARPDAMLIDNASLKKELHQLWQRLL